MMLINPLSFNNEVFRGFVTWGGFLLVKMLLMSILTGAQRFRKGAYDNPEDVQGRENIEVKKDENVERVRRAHLNDLENIPAFLIAGLFYVCSDPNIDVALWLFRIAVVARFLHTFVYAIYPIRQPARVLCFTTCLVITIYMTVASIVALFRI